MINIISMSSESAGTSIIQENASYPQLQKESNAAPLAQHLN